MKQHHHVYSMDYYACRSSLRGAAPGFKVFFSVLVLITCLWADNALVSCFVTLSMAVLNMGKNRVGLRAYLHLLTIPAVFILLGCCALLLDAGYGEQGWFLCITKETAGTGIHVMLRTFGAVSALYFLTLSTPVGEVISVLERLHMPRTVTELMHLIYRYIFILLESHNQMWTAAQSRLGCRDFRTGCRTFGASLGNLLVISLKRSRECYDAMEARCYEGELVFAEEEREFKIRWLLWAFLYWVAAVGIKTGTERGGWL